MVRDRQQRVAYHLEREPRPKPDPLGAHVAFDVEDFDETKRTLKEMGIEFLEAPSNMGAGRQLWIVDPDGNTVELRTEK